MLCPGSFDQSLSCCGHSVVRHGRPDVAAVYRCCRCGREYTSGHAVAATINVDGRAVDVRGYAIDGVIEDVRATEELTPDDGERAMDALLDQAK